MRISLGKLLNLGIENIMHLPIKQWSIEDRPREKFSSQGKKSLSDAELLAIIIGHGTREFSALHIAKLILSKNNHSLNKVRDSDLSELMKIPGIGKTKAISILTALELGNRCDKFKSEKIKITSSNSAFEFIKDKFFGLKHEEFHIILLNNAHFIVDRICISKGGLTSTIADGRIIFKQALMKQATSIILIHNHPSGNLKPSDADVNLTKNLKEFGKCIDIKIVDHLIIADNLYFSFADEGLL